MLDQEGAEADTLEQTRQVVEDEDTDRREPEGVGPALPEADPADVHEQSRGTGDAEDAYPPDQPP